MLMQELNLPKINIKSKLVDESIQIFDIVRKKYLLLHQKNGSATCCTLFDFS